MVSLTVLKVILGLVMMLLTAVFGFLPIPILKFLRRRRRDDGASGRRDTNRSEFGGRKWPALVLCLLFCFTGGVFLGTCFLHLYPEMEEHLASVLEKEGVEVDYPLAELIAMSGFFFIFGIEELAVGLCQSRKVADTKATPEKRAKDGGEMGTTASADAIEMSEPGRTDSEGSEEESSLVKKPKTHFIRSLTLVLALSFHAIVEGIALGISKTNAAATSLFLSLIIHKVVVAFSMGLQLGRAHRDSLKPVLASVSLLVVMSPLGILIGTLTMETTEESLGKDVAILTLEGLAVGTFLYVVFFEILFHERDNGHSNGLKLLAMMLGFGIVGSLRLLEHEEADPPANVTITSTSSPL